MYIYGNMEHLGKLFRQEITGKQINKYGTGGAWYGGWNYEKAADFLGRKWKIGIFLGTNIGIEGWKQLNFVYIFLGKKHLGVFLETNRGIEGWNYGTEAA